MKKILLGACALLVSAAASANPYAELAIGQSDVDADCAGTTSCDNKDTGVRLTGGWAFTPNLAGELSYTDYGKASAVVSGSTVTLKAKGISFGVAGTYPLGSQFSVTGRLGLINIEATGTVVGTGSVSETKLKPYFGLGLGYDLNKAVSLGLNWEQTKASLQGASSDVSLISLSARYRF